MTLCQVSGVIVTVVSVPYVDKKCQIRRCRVVEKKTNVTSSHCVSQAERHGVSHGDTRAEPPFRSCPSE